MVIIDGLGDEPITELNGITPLAAAFAPNLHYIASRGKVGRIETTFPGFPIESMVCIMGLLGYEPEKYYPTGRASFEALAKGIPLNANDLIFRCNTITVDKNKQTLADFTGGLISDSDARKLISRITLPFDHWVLIPSARHYRRTHPLIGARPRFSGNRLAILYRSRVSCPASQRRRASHAVQPGFRCFPD